MAFRAGKKEPAVAGKQWPRLGWHLRASHYRPRRPP